jgi:hypothetical protein
MVAGGGILGTVVILVSWLEEELGLLQAADTIIKETARAAGKKRFIAIY